MADKEETKPLLLPEEEILMSQLYPDIPPPAYDGPKEKPVVLQTTTAATPLPLPTYEQSEKYEKDGVLEYNDYSDGTIRIVSSQQTDRSTGSSCDFIVFFMVCFFFSWIGYLLSCCLATTIAAQAGAAAGLGLSLVVKTIFVEFQPNYLTSIVHSMCSDDYYYIYDDTSFHAQDWNSCTKRYYSFVRLFFWILGFLGLFLFARGLSVFCQTRPRRQPTQVSSA